MPALKFVPHIRNRWNQIIKELREWTVFGAEINGRADYLFK
jgi:hypothetical protein